MIPVQLLKSVRCMYIHILDQCNVRVMPGIPMLSSVRFFTAEKTCSSEWRDFAMSTGRETVQVVSTGVSFGKSTKLRLTHL